MCTCLYKQDEKGKGFCIFFNSYLLQSEARSPIPCDIFTSKKTGRTNMCMKSEPTQSHPNLNLHKLKFIKHKYNFTIKNWENSIVNNVKRTCK